MDQAVDDLASGFESRRSKKLLFESLVVRLAGLQDRGGAETMILIGIGIIVLAVAVFIAGTDIAMALQKIATEIRLKK